MGSGVMKPWMKDEEQGWPGALGQQMLRRAREHCKMLTGVDVTGVPEMKPTDGTTA